MKDYPVIKLTIIFIVGILSAEFFQINLSFVIIIFLVSAILILLLKKYEANTYYSLLAFLSTGILIFSIGNLLAKENKISFNSYLSKIDKVKNTIAFGEINKIDLLKKDQLNFYLSVDSMKSDDFYIKNKFLLLCRIRDSNNFEI